MNENNKQIQSVKHKEIGCFMDDKVGIYHFQILEEYGKSNEEKDFWVEGAEYAYEIFKVLKKADELGGFDEFKTNEAGEKEIIIPV